MRITEAQFNALTRKRPIRRRLTASQFAPVAAQFNFPVWTLTLPLAVVSEANQREFWAKKHRRSASQREQIAQEWLVAFGKNTPKPPCRIRLTRLGGTRIDTDDNLNISFKAVRDELARIIGLDDRSPLYTWEYAQEPGGERGIRIEIEEATS